MPNKYNINVNIFKEITPNSAWVIGWILSDGCVYNNRLSIGLNSKDKEVLYKIKDIMGYEGPISDSLTKNRFLSSRLGIYNKSKELYNLMISKRKRPIKISLCYN